MLKLSIIYAYGDSIKRRAFYAYLGLNRLKQNVDTEY